jgi:hypothetical protein
VEEARAVGAASVSVLAGFGSKLDVISKTGFVIVEAAGGEDSPVGTSAGAGLQAARRVMTKQIFTNQPGPGRSSGLITLFLQ